MRTQRQIKVPPEYFRKARDEYTDWRTAWWREAIQNSVDAGARTLDIQLTQGEDSVRIRFADDGRGMSQKTLIETFLALGGSEKPEDAIGGFGYAKNLLCFAHKHYRISTGVERVEGRGGDYEHWQVDASESVKGVTLEVEIQDERNLHYRLKDELLKLLNASKLPRTLTVRLNGESLEPTPPDAKLPFKVKSELGPLQFRDAKFGPSRLWVRLGGLAMFPVTIWTENSHFQGVLDLEGKSLDLLTSNRDSLRGDRGDALQRIVQKLANERGALKCNSLIDLTLNFEPVDIEVPAEVDEPAEETPVDRDPLAQATSQTSIMSGEQLAQATRVTAKQRMTKMNLPDANETPEQKTFRKLAEKRQAALKKLQDRLGQIDTRGYPKTFRIRTAELGAEERRDPAAAYTPVLRKLGQERVQKLARAWEATLKAVLSQPMAMMSGIDWKNGRPFKDGRPINAGFVFSDQLEGLHVPHPDGAYDVLMNPDCMQRLDVEDLLDLALHEVTHLWVSGHHEGFTTLESKLRRGMRKFMPIAELRKTVRAAIDNQPEAVKSNPLAAESAEPSCVDDKPVPAFVPPVRQGLSPEAAESKESTERRRAPAPF